MASDVSAFTTIFIVGMIFFTIAVIGACSNNRKGR